MRRQSRGLPLGHPKSGVVADFQLALELPRAIRHARGAGIGFRRERTQQLQVRRRRRG